MTETNSIVNFEQKFLNVTGENFTTFYSKNRKVIIGLLLRISDDLSQVEEACDRAFTIAVEKFDSYDKTKSKFITWVSNVARYELYALFNKNERRKKVHESSKNLESNPFSENSYLKISKEFDSQKFIDFLPLAVNQLPNKYYEVMTLRVLKNLSYKQISERLNLEINTVKSRIRLGKEKIIRIYRDNGFEYSCVNI